jgi:hypothetical protein
MILDQSGKLPDAMKHLTPSEMLDVCALVGVIREQVARAEHAEADCAALRQELDETRRLLSNSRADHKDCMRREDAMREELSALRASHGRLIALAR